MRVPTAPVLLRDARLIDICKAIVFAFSDLPQEEVNSISRCYSRTFDLVMLCNDKLATPTRNARTRIEDLYSAVERECGRRGFNRDYLTETVLRNHHEKSIT